MRVAQLSISDGELALELPQGGAIGGLGKNVDVVLEGRGNGGDIEAELTVPHLSNGANGLGALAVVGVGCISSARVSLIEDLGASHVADELDVVERAAIDVPDALDEELLDVGGLDGIGARVGAVGEGRHVLLSRDLGDNQAVAGRGIDHPWLVSDSDGGESGGEESLHLFKRKIIIIGISCLPHIQLRPWGFGVLGFWG